MRNGEEVYRKIDEIVNIDLGRAGTRLLYDETQKDGNLMCFSAAKKLVDVVHSRNVVLLCTGASIYPWNVNETDGPIGVAALARSLSIAFDARPMVLVDEGVIDLLSVTCRAMELNAVTEAKHLIEYPHTVAVASFPSENKKAKEESDRLIKELNPVAIIAVEAAGANSKGVYHNMGGKSRLDSPGVRIARFDYLFAEAKSQGIFTVGIGDGGNEIGMGNVKDAVKKCIPFGERCMCPCGGGIAAEAMVDSLVISTVANWGAYGISASLSRILDNPSILHSTILERRTIERCVAAGGFNGSTRTPEHAVDGIPMDVHIGIVNMLQIVR